MRRRVQLTGQVTHSNMVRQFHISVWMYVIREMEDAVTDCTAGNVVLQYYIEHHMQIS